MSKSTGMDEQIKSTEKGLQKKISDIENSISGRVSGFDAELAKLLRQKSDSFDGEFLKIETEARSKIDLISGRIEEEFLKTDEEIKSNLNKKIMDIYNQVSTITKEFENRKKEIEEKISGLTDGVEVQFRQLEGDYSNKITEIEQKFGKINTDIMTLEKKFQNESEALFTKANADLSKEIDSLKKSVEINAQERLSRMDEKITEEIQKFEEQFNGNIKNFNAKLAANSNTINEMNGKLAKFIKDVTDKFKGEVSSLKSSTVLESEKYLEKIGASEKAMQTMMASLQNSLAAAGEEIKSLGKEAAESLVEKIEGKENEIFFEY